MLSSNKTKIKLKSKTFPKPNNAIMKIEYKNTKEKGNIYELYIYYHLLETNKYKNVWLWKNVPEYELLKSGIMDNWNNARLIRKREQNNSIKNNLPDFGTDLFALETDKNDNENNINKYSIIQCKNYDDSRNLRPEDLGTFYFMMYRYSRFVNGLVFHTNNLCENLINLSNTNDNIKYNRVNIETDKYKLYNLDTLHSISDDISDDISNVNNEIPNIILEPHQYQLDAYLALKDKHRTVLQMACGTGKTLVSILLAKDYKQNIIISPLKAYCEQNMERFTSQMSDDYKMLIIDGDNDGRNINKIINFIKNNEKICLFVTYKSIDIINQLISYVNDNDDDNDDDNDIKLLNDYFVIIDEFHNISYNDVYENDEEELEEDEEELEEDEEELEDESNESNESNESSEIKVIMHSEMYNLLHSDSRIMFMSATPRLFGDDLDSPDDVEIDNDIFGNIDYTYSMSSAIDEGKICDYKIFVPTLKILKETGIDLIYNEANLKDYDKELVIKSRYIIKGMMEIGSRKCIIYLQSQNECREMSNIIKEQCKNYFAISNNCNYIISSDLKDERKAKLNQFIDFDGYSFLCSVDILNECIDIPKCDSIFIAYPSKSKIRNIQRLCRANRKDKENPNKVASIFLWCDDYKDDLADFLCHIKEYDSKFTFDKIKRLNVSNESKTLMMPEIETEENKNLEKLVIGFRSVEGWIEKLDKLKIYIDENKKRPSSKSKDKVIKSMVNWISNCQKNYSKKTQNMKDEAIYNLWKEFINNSRYKEYFLSQYDSFICNLNKLKLYIDENKKRPSQNSKDKVIKSMGNWLGDQQKHYKKFKKNMKTLLIKQKFEEFINNDKYKIYFLTQYENFIININKVKTYIDNNNKRPSMLDTDKHINKLSSWLDVQTKYYNKNINNMLNLQIKNQWIEFINNDKYKIYFQSQEDNFIINLSKLKDYINNNNKLPSNSSKDNNLKYLARWIRTQKSNYEKKKYIMLNLQIKNQWIEFINDAQYKEHFLSQYDRFVFDLNKLKLYIDTNKKRPSKINKIREIKSMGSWISDCQTNYSKKLYNMDDEAIYNLWKGFINDDKYKKYF